MFAKRFCNYRKRFSVIEFFAFSVIEFFGIFANTPLMTKTGKI